MMELKYEFYIDAEPKKVWDALVSPEGTRKTFFGCVIKSTFKKGDSLAYIGPGNDGDETVHVYGQILDCEPYQVLSYLEHPGSTYYSNHEEIESRITFTLETVGKCTKLTLVNDQWSADHPGIKKAEETWWIVLSNIKTFVETGKTIDFGW